MRNGTPPKWKDYELGPDFDRAREQISTPFQFVDFALDNATSNLLVNISGDFIYVDASSTGIATMELNTQYADTQAPFQIQAGFAIEAVFKQIRLSWSGQAGKTIRILYSTGERVIPASQLAMINGIVQPVNINDVVSASCQVLLASYTATGSGFVATQLLAPAANVNGAIVRSAELNVVGATNAGNGILVAAQNAPTAIAAQANACHFGFLYAPSGAVQWETENLFRRLPPGWGIWLGLSASAAGPWAQAFVSLELL